MSLGVLLGQDFGLVMDDAFNAVKDVSVHGEYPATHCNKRATKGLSPMTAEIAQKWFCPFEKVSFHCHHCLL